jgi:hypothetical protein
MMAISAPASTPLASTKAAAMASWTKMAGPLSRCASALHHPHSADAGGAARALPARALSSARSRPADAQLHVHEGDSVRLVALDLVHERLPC